MNGTVHEAQDDPFVAALEDAIMNVLGNTKCSQRDKVAAIVAGIKLAQIKHKIAPQAEPMEFFSS